MGTRGEGMPIWDVLDGRAGAMFVEDVSAWAQRRDDRRKRTYHTFITAPVAAGGIPFGLLTVNAVKPGSLLREDVMFVEAIARVRGIVEPLCLSPDEYRRVLAVQARRPTLSEITPSTAIDTEGSAR